MVLGALLLSLFFSSMAIFVIDVGLLVAGYQQLSETLQASAEDGVQLDVAQLRSSNGAIHVVDPVAARATADASMRASDVPGLMSWKVNTTANRVIVTGRVRIQLFAMPPVSIAESRAARLAYGQ
jgi:hypothetical protein